jgi:anti-sigma factor RsiW
MRERISARLSGELDAAERNELDRHLAQCPACGEHAVELERLWSALGDEPVPSDRMRARVHELIAHEARTTPTTGRQWRRIAERLLPIAATLVLGVGLGYLWGDGERNEVAALRGEVADLHAAVAASLLGQSSVSARLRGVAYTRDLGSDGDAVTDALLHALREDPDVNVRLAALEALVPQLSHDGRQGELVSAVAVQSSPLVQLSLIDALLETGGAPVRRELERLVTDPRLDLPVRGYLRDRLARSV